MVDPAITEAHYVRCLKCKQILKCSRYDTRVLLEHIRTLHPDIEIIGGGVIDDSKSKFDPHSLAKTAEAFKAAASGEQGAEIAAKVQEFCDDIKKVKDEKYNCKHAYKRRFETQCPRAPKKRGLYRTSIEKWRPIHGTIYCPNCGCNKPPLLKTKTERLSENSCGAACILGCWPFCFLPCCFSDDNHEYLHCSNCMTFLGLYDREHNCVKPNREYIEVKETVTRETVI